MLCARISTGRVGRVAAAANDYDNINVPFNPGHRETGRIADVHRASAGRLSPFCGGSGGVDGGSLCVHNQNCAPTRQAPPSMPTIMSLALGSACNRRDGAANARPGFGGTFNVCVCRSVAKFGMAGEWWMIQTNTDIYRKFISLLIHSGAR